MKIAISSQGTGLDSAVDMRFGRASCFILYDTDDNTFLSVSNEQNLQAAQGAGIQSAATVVNSGCLTLITGHCGPKAYTALTNAGVTVYVTKGGTVQEIIDLFNSGLLKKIDTADVEGHW